MNIIDEMLETREIHELIMEIREELTERKKYRKEQLEKMEEISFYLKKLFE